MASVGKPRAIDSPKDFEELAFEYIEWVKNNPVMKTITANFQGVITHEKVPHTRGMTQFGLAAHMGIGLSTLKDYGNRDEYSAIYERVDTIMKAWNLDGSMSGDLNASMVARIDKHADKQEIKQQVNITDLSDDDLDKKIRELQKE